MHLRFFWFQNDNRRYGFKLVYCCYLHSERKYLINMMVDETLPITINADKAALSLFPNIQSVCNKLEAQLNFIAMTAGWFAEQQHEVSLSFVISIGVLEKHADYQGCDQIIQIADDAVLAYHQSSLHYQGFLSITETEQQAINQQSAVLPLLLDKKCTLMLNAVAERESLHTL